MSVRRWEEARGVGYVRMPLSFLFTLKFVRVLVIAAGLLFPFLPNR